MRAKKSKDRYLRTEGVLDSAYLEKKTELEGFAKAFRLFITMNHQYSARMKLVAALTKVGLA